MLKKTFAVLAATWLLLAFALAGCGTPDAAKDTGAAAGNQTPSGKADVQKAPELDKTPVHLTASCIGACIDPDEFQQTVADPLNQKYPFLTIELLPKKPVDDVIASGEIPDLYFSGILDVSVLKEYGLQFDLRPMIKKWNVDLSKFQKSSIDMVGKYGDKGEVYSIPYRNNFFALYYNKDIFDRFAVPYPKDSMNWADTIALARKVTRNDGGVQYQGLSNMAYARLSLTMLQNKYDPKTQKATLETDGWKKTMQIFKDIHSIPGNEKNSPAKDFTNNQTIAMFAGSGQFPQWEKLHQEGHPLNWDMVSFPTMKDNYKKVDSPLSIISLTSTSKHKDQAFQAILAAVSKESQIKFTSWVKLTVINDENIKSKFGSAYETLKGKNLKAPSYNEFVPVNVSSPYDEAINKIINKAADQVVTGKLDINTALRQAEDSANAAIEDLKKK
jgi:multiple sugar transport system substrate-binding protein